MGGLIPGAVRWLRVPGSCSTAKIAALSLPPMRRPNKTLWTLHLNANWHASPMVYQFDGRELIGIVVGSTVMALGIPE